MSLHEGYKDNYLSLYRMIHRMKRECAHFVLAYMIFVLAAKVGRLDEEMLMEPGDVILLVYQQCCVGSWRVLPAHSFSFSSVFSTVPNSLHLSNPEAFIMTNWTCNYLHGRPQYVLLNDAPFTMLNL